MGNPWKHRTINLWLNTTRENNGLLSHTKWSAYVRIFVPLMPCLSSCLKSMFFTKIMRFLISKMRHVELNYLNYYSNVNSTCLSLFTFQILLSVLWFFRDAVNKRRWQRLRHCLSSSSSKSSKQYYVRWSTVIVTLHLLWCPSASVMKQS